MLTPFLIGAPDLVTADPQTLPDEEVMMKLRSLNKMMQYLTNISSTRLRQCEPEGASLTWHAIYTNFTLVSADDVGTDKQTQSQAGILLLFAYGLVISVKKQGYLFLSDTWSIIGNRDLYKILPFLNLCFQLGRSRCIFDGITDQVCEYPANTF